MDNPGLTQQIKAILVCAAGLLFAIFLGTQIGAENYPQLLLGTVIVIVASISFFSGRLFWVLTIASSFLGGTFPILGGQFTTFQILMAIGIAKFFLGDVVMRRTKLRLGTRTDALLILGFMAILLWHGIHDRFGMRFLGSSVWGGRNYVNVFVGLAAFVVIQSIPMSPKLWAKLPHAILAVTVFDTAIAIITTIFPQTIREIYPFYSAVSMLGIEEILGTDLDVTGRIGAFGNIGFMLVLFVLASISVREILSPSNLFRLFTVAVGFLGALYSGFRSAVVNTLLAMLAAGIRDLKWAVLAILPFVAMALFALSVINSEFVALPKQIQRSLTFVPGHWDVDMATDAIASNDFRQKIWTMWAREYFPEHPWLGRGFGFRSDWTQITQINQNRYGTQQMVETGNMHNGFFSSVDAFGVIGTAFFAIWNLRLLGRTFRVPSPRRDPEKFALRFLALYLAVSITSYWIGALSVGSFLPQEFAVAAVFLRMQRVMEERSETVESSEPASEVHSERFATA